MEASPPRVAGAAGRGRHMRVTLTPKDEERLLALMTRERPRSAVVAPGGDLVTAGGGGDKIGRAHV